MNFVIVEDSKVKAANLVVIEQSKPKSSSFILVDENPTVTVKDEVSAPCEPEAAQQFTRKFTASAPPVPAQPRRVRQVGDAVSALATNRPQQQVLTKSDRRWAIRKLADMPAFIAHSKNPHGARCIVRNTSSSGALVEVLAGSDRNRNPADEIPDVMTLVFINYKERTEVACTVMRRVGTKLGLRYVGAFRTYAAPGSKPTAPAKPARKR